MRSAAVLVSLVATGCVCLPILGGPPPREEGPPPPLVEGFADLRGIVHCHSKLSHDSSGEWEDMAGAAAETSCSFVALTDHLRRREDVRDEPTGRIEGVLFLPGAELNCNKGSLLSIGVAAGIDRNLPAAELIAQVRSLGGVAAIGHPESWQLGDVTDVDGCELENLHADSLDENKASLVFRFWFFPPRPFFSSLIDRQPRAMAVYDSLARARPLAAIGACDAHEAIKPLGPLGGAVDSYRRAFRTVNTHLLVPADRTGGALVASDVLAALRAGRSYAASELTHDATGFSFVARDANGSVAATLGGAARLAPGLALEVVLPAAGRIVLLRDGADVLVVDGTTARFEPHAKGAYRVEASHHGKPWIWSSAVRVE